MHSRSLSSLCLLLSLSGLLFGCERAALMSKFLGGTLSSLGDETLPAPGKMKDPVRPNARLAALWVGHATVLVQMDDKFILTDPVFTHTVGNVSARLVEPGLDPEDLPPLDAVLVSHLHFDHLSLGSLDLIEDKMKRLVVPEGGTVYVPSSSVPPIELRTWESFEKDGLRITATPVEHVGFRYGADVSWAVTGFTGYVVEYAGLSFYFGGDTAHSNWKHHATGRRFPDLDLAFLPIAPIHPREFMCKTHVDPAEALDLFFDLGAKRMMAIHYDTFFNSLDAMGEAPATLRKLLPERGLTEDDVAILRHGEQRVFIERAPVASPVIRAESVQ